MTKLCKGAGFTRLYRSLTKVHTVLQRTHNHQLANARNTKSLYTLIGTLYFFESIKKAVSLHANLQCYFMRLLLLLLAFFLISCNNNDKKIIDGAEHIVSINADSALNMLHQINDFDKLDEAYLSKYWLTVGQAHCNKGEAMTEDSLICHALDYYRSLEPRDNSRLLQATILSSNYYWWIGEKETAYQLLKDALGQYEKTNDKKSTISILKTLYQLYASDNDFATSRHYLSLLMEYDKENTGMMFQYLDNLSVLNYYVNDRAAVESSFDNIVNNIHTPQDSTLYWKYTLRSYADISSDMGNQYKAIDLQNKVLNHFMGKDNTEVSLSYASLSRYYLLLGDLKQAASYLQLANHTATETTNNDLSYAGYYQILHLLLDYANTQNVNFKEWALFVNNLQENAEHKRKITDAKVKSNQQLIERNLNLMISHQREQIIAMYVIFAFTLTLSILLFYIRRKKKLLEEKAEELDALRKLIVESQNSDDNNDDRFFKKIMLQQLGVIRIAASNPTTANQELLKRMTEIANKEVEVDALLVWDDLYKSIDYIYDGYYTHIVSAYREILNEKEIQLCCLLRANFSTKEISVVTQQGIRTVYQRKTVIRQKLEMEEKGDIIDYLSKQ